MYGRCDIFDVIDLLFSGRVVVLALVVNAFPASCGFLVVSRALPYAYLLPGGFLSVS